MLVILFYVLSNRYIGTLPESLFYWLRLNLGYLPKFWILFLLKGDRLNVSHLFIYLNQTEIRIISGHPAIDNIISIYHQQLYWTSNEYTNILLKTYLLASNKMPTYQLTYLLTLWHILSEATSLPNMEIISSQEILFRKSNSMWVSWAAINSGFISLT